MHDPARVLASIEPLCRNNTMPESRRRTGSDNPRPPATRTFARIVVPLAILATTATLLAITGARALERLPDVRVTPVALISTTSRGSASSAIDDESGTVQAPGWIEPAPFATEIRALRDGTIAEILVLEGAAVAEGDVIARLEDAAERIALVKADATLAARARELHESAAATMIATQALELASASSERLYAAEAAAAEARLLADRVSAEIAAAEAEAAEAKDLLETRKMLITPGGATEGEVRRLGLRVQALTARVDALRSEAPTRHARAEALARSELIARRARELLVTERSALVEAKRTEAKIAAEYADALASQEYAALALSRSEIRAPHAGVMLSRNAVVGGRASLEGAPIALLYDPNHLQIRCDVPAKDAAFLAIGLAAEIRTDALPDRVIEGIVERLVPLGDLQKNTVQCKVRIVDPPAELRADMLVRVKIRARTTSRNAQREGVAIPVTALLSESGEVVSANSSPSQGSSAFVLVAIPEAGAARVERRSIVVGTLRANNWIEVDEGLAGGDRVVLPDPSEGASDSRSMALLAATLEGMRVNLREIHLAAPYETIPDVGSEHENAMGDSEADRDASSHKNSAPGSREDVSRE